MRLGGWDGHVHSALCPHGERDATEARIERAVALGLERMTLAEHAPLPPGVLPPEEAAQLAPDPDTFLRYLEEAQALQARFRGVIEVRVGAEVDFVPHRVEATRAWLQRHGDTLDEWILSVHLVPGQGGLREVDGRQQVVERELVTVHGGRESLAAAYLTLVWAAVATDWGPKPPARLGHLTRVHRFCPDAPVPQGLVEEILRVVRGQGMAMDVNTSGLDAEGGRLEPPLALALRAKALGIALVLGSDAHGVKAVGRHFSTVAPLLEGAAGPA